MVSPEQSGQRCISGAEVPLAYPNPNKEYLLEAGTLKLGPGAVLSQKQSDGRYHLVAFMSRLYMEQMSITTVQSSRFWP